MCFGRGRVPSHVTSRATGRCRMHGGVRYYLRRVATLGEALSHAFRVTLVQTVPGRTLTLPHALLRPPERQRRLTRSPRRPSDDRIASAAAILALRASAKAPKMARRSGPEHRGELHLAVFPHLQRPLQAAVSCTAIEIRLGCEHERACSADSAPACINLCSSTDHASREQHRVSSGSMNEP